MGSAPFCIEIQALPAVADGGPNLPPSGILAEHKYDHPPAVTAGFIAVQLEKTIVAIGQAVLAGIGLAVAGVPFAAILTAVMFMLCLAQIGPAPVLLAGVVWLYWKGTAGWGTALLIWTIVVGTVDNVVRRAKELLDE